MDCRLGFLDELDIEPGIDAFVVMGNFQLHPDPVATLSRTAELAAPGATLFLDTKNPVSSARRVASRLVTTAPFNKVAAVHAFAAHSSHGIRNAPSQGRLKRNLEGAGWVVDQIRTTGPRLLRFGNTHDLAQGVRGKVWRATDAVDGITNERAWIQVSAHRA